MDRSRSLPDFDKSLPLPFPFLSSKRIDDFCCQRIACTLCFCKIQDAPCRILPRLHAPATLRLLKRLGERVEASRMNGYPMPCFASHPGGSSFSNAHQWPSKSERIFIAWAWGTECLTKQHKMFLVVVLFLMCMTFPSTALLRPRQDRFEMV